MSTKFVKEEEPSKEIKSKWDFIAPLTLIIFFIGVGYLVSLGVQKHNKIYSENKQHCENNSSKALFDSRGSFIACIKNEVIVK